MSKVVLNESLKAMLGDVTNPFHIYDETGRIVLWVTPVSHPSLYREIEDDLSEEEWKRRAEEPGRSLQEIIADLERKHS